MCLAAGVRARSHTRSTTGLPEQEAAYYTSQACLAPGLPSLSLLPGPPGVWGSASLRSGLSPPTLLDLTDPQGGSWTASFWKKVRPHPHPGAYILPVKMARTGCSGHSGPVPRGAPNTAVSFPHTCPALTSCRNPSPLLEAVAGGNLWGAGAGEMTSEGSPGMGGGNGHSHTLPGSLLTQLHPPHAAAGWGPQGNVLLPRQGGESPGPRQGMRHHWLVARVVHDLTCFSMRLLESQTSWATQDSPARAGSKGRGLLSDGCSAPFPVCSLAAHSSTSFHRMDL